MNNDLIIDLIRSLDRKKILELKNADDKIYLTMSLKKFTPYIDNLVRFKLFSKDCLYFIGADCAVNDSNFFLGYHILSVFAKNTLSTSKIDLQLFSPDKNDIADTYYLCFPTTSAHRIVCEFVDEIQNNWDKYYRICPVCFELKGTRIVVEPCDGCFSKSFKVIYNNMIIGYYNKDPNLFKLILYTSLQALDKKDRFEPKPIYCTAGQFETEHMKHISRSFDHYIKMINICTSDWMLKKLIGEKEYMFLRHTVQSNNTSLNYFDNNASNSMIREKDVWENDNIILFSVNHPMEKQQRFDDSIDLVHMFHGSPISNWYSIMRNGLKNCSGTKMMTHGQAHGSGIYLGANIATSLGYCNNTSPDQYSIVGVVQLLNSHLYKKTEDIYVVPEENDVLLKYLILIKKRKTNNMVDIEKYLTKEMPTSKRASMSASIMVSGKRINKEYDKLTGLVKKLQKNNNLHKITLHANDMAKWDVVLERLDRSNDRIVISVLFPKIYPLNPPTINVNQKIDLPMITETFDQMGKKKLYTYSDPILRYDCWRSDVKIYEVLNQLIINILDNI
jgi:ubiquitin-protein ligase